MPGWRDLEQPDLLACLLTTRNCSASDPRDKVFGVLNLAGAEVRSLVIVDYTLSIEKVYANAAAAVIAERNDLSVLSHVHGTRSSQANWPSWVPDWRYPITSVLTQFSKAIHSTAFIQSTTDLFTFYTMKKWVAKSEEISVLTVPSAQGLSVGEQGTPLAYNSASFVLSGMAGAPQLSPVLLNHCLRVRAYIIDSIHFIGWTDMNFKSARQYAKNSESYWKAIDEDRAASRARSGRVYVPALFKESPKDSEETSHGKHFQLHMQSLEHEFRDPALKSPSPSMHEVFGDTEPYQEFLKAAQRMGNRLSIFRTEYSLGFGNYRAQDWMRGDIVAALDGARAPFILHRYDRNKYRIVCDCYLMGALEYDTWKQKGGRGPWGELPDPGPEEERSLMIDIY